MSLSVKDRVQLLETSALGLSSEAIAAIIGVDVTDVVAVRTHPDANPPTPGGGGGAPGIYTFSTGDGLSAKAAPESNLLFVSNGGADSNVGISDVPPGALGEGTPGFTLVSFATPSPMDKLFACDAALVAPRGSFGNRVSIPRSGGAAGVSACTGPTTIAPGSANGFQAHFQLDSFSAGTLAASVLLVVSNLDATEKLVLQSESYDLSNKSATGEDFDLTGFTVLESVGSDLAIGHENVYIDSTAGGQFIASLAVAFNANALTP